jgi:hypothetical protein
MRRSDHRVKAINTVPMQGDFSASSCSLCRYKWEASQPLSPLSSRAFDIPILPEQFSSLCDSSGMLH